MPGDVRSLVHVPLAGFDESIVINWLRKQGK